MRRALWHQRTLRSGARADIHMACHGFCMAKKANAGSFKRGHDGRKSRIDDHADHMDAVVNALTGQGVIGQDKTSANCYAPDIVPALQGMQIYRGNPIGARIVDNPINAALRQGFDLCIGDADMPDPFTPEKTELPKAPPLNVNSRKPTTDWHQHPGALTRAVRARIDNARARRMDAESDGKQLSEDISKHLEDLKATNMIREAWTYARAAGGGACLIGANDFTTDLRTPLDLRKVRSLDYLTPLECLELVPLYWYTNPREPGGKFGHPAIYSLVPYNAGAPAPGELYNASFTQIHESRLLVLDGTRVTRRNIGTNSGWGDSIFTRVGRALMQYDSSTQGAAQLMADFAQAVYKVKGLKDLLMKDKNALRDKMVQVNIMRSIIRALVLDADGEDFERKATPMSGYPETMDRQATNLAAAAGQPLSLIFGQSPAGLNATGDSDIRWFYDMCAGEQQRVLAPAMLRLAEIELAVRGEDPATVNHSVRFKPLWQPTEKEQADARFTQAQTDQIYIVNDVITPEEVAWNRFGGDQGSLETKIDFEARAAGDAVVAPAVDAMTPAPGTDPNAPPMKAGDDSAE